MSSRILWLFPLVFLASCGGSEPANVQHMQASSAHLEMAEQRNLVAATVPVTLPYRRSAYLVIATENGSTVRLVSNPDDQGILVQPNTVIRFSDTSILPYIENGNIGMAYRLYRAAFARTPDMPGLLFWINHLNAGLSLDTMANGFVSSPEFRSLYGTNEAEPSIIARLYRNVLGREPDVGGLEFWQNALAKGVSLPEILEAFSESAENKSSTTAEVSGGIAFIEDGVAYPGTAAPTADVSLVLTGRNFVGSTLIAKADSRTAVSAQAAYSWSVMSKPANSKLNVAGSASQLTFIPDVPGTYHIGLTISDGGRKLSGSLQVTVTEQRLLNQPYLAKNGMTVTLEKMAVTDRGNGYVDYAVTYVQANKSNLAIDEGALKLYFQGATPLPQYGFFNKIYPGDTLRRTHIFTQLRTDTPSVLEYDQDNFFRNAPAIDSLQWPVPLN